jgi:hypothetical protein
MAMATFTVRKLNTRGELVTSYTAQLVRWLPGGVLVDARWTRPPLALGYATFETGDHFREVFYTDRWYSIFEIRSAGDALKGWYCNVAEPATVHGDVIDSRDLILDLWVAPDGTTTVLDEDELAADTTLDTATRQKARRALGELERLVREHAPPFDQAFSAR